MNKTTLYAWIIVIAFLIGLGGIILLALYEVDWHITVIFVGGVIFLMGLIIAAIAKINLRTAPILIICIVGALFMGIPAWFLYAEKHPDKVPQLTDAQSMNIISGGIMALAGICVMLFPLLSALYKKRRCTEAIMATCVEILVDKVKLSHSTEYVRCPVWEFDFEGQTYRVTESSFSDHENVDVGDIQEIFIDPNNPKHIYRKLKTSIKQVVIFGSFFVIIGMWLLISGIFWI